MKQKHFKATTSRTREQVPKNVFFLPSSSLSFVQLPLFSRATHTFLSLSVSTHLFVSVAQPHSRRHCAASDRVSALCVVGTPLTSSCQPRVRAHSTPFDFELSLTLSLSCLRRSLYDICAALTIHESTRNTWTHAHVSSHTRNTALYNTKRLHVRTLSLARSPAFKELQNPATEREDLFKIQQHRERSYSKSSNTER